MRPLKLRRINVSLFCYFLRKLKQISIHSLFLYSSVLNVIRIASVRPIALRPLPSLLGAVDICPITSEREDVCAKVGAADKAKEP